MTDGGQRPVAGVRVSAGSLGASTDASGYYTITGLIGGTYTLTPMLSGYSFSPPTRTVSLPSNATGQDFSVSAKPSPGARWASGFAYDSTAAHLVLFGGWRQRIPQ